MSSVLFVAWRSDDGDRPWGPIGRLEHVPGTYTFRYTKGAQLLSGFRGLVGMPDLLGTYRSTELFPVFANRLLSRSRREYTAYLRWAGFDPAQPLDPISLLGVTEGRRETDSLELFPCPLPDGDGLHFYSFFAHGVRGPSERLFDYSSLLKPGVGLSLVANRLDAGAGVAVQLHAMFGNSSVCVGQVPRYLGREIGPLLQDDPAHLLIANVQHVNLDAPLEYRVLCSMRVRWPVGHGACQGVEFGPASVEWVGEPA